MYNASDDAVAELWELADQLHEDAERAKNNHPRQSRIYGMGIGKEKAGDALAELIREIEADND